MIYRCTTVHVHAHTHAHTHMHTHTNAQKAVPDSYVKPSIYKDWKWCDPPEIGVLNV